MKGIAESWSGEIGVGGEDVTKKECERPQEP